MFPMNSGNESMELLQKALTAGSGVNAATFTGGRALSVESLEGSSKPVFKTERRPKKK